MLKKKEKHEDGIYIYRASITKDGKKIYAKEYGLKAFKIRVDK